MKGSSTSPPPFGWDDWYASVGGRSIHVTEVDSILHEIKEYQFPKIKGEGNPVTDPEVPKYWYPHFNRENL